jgi:hypothetical protein
MNGAPSSGSRHKRAKDCAFLKVHFGAKFPDKSVGGMVWSVGEAGNRRPGLEKVSGLLRIFRN